MLEIKKNSFIIFQYQLKTLKLWMNVSKNIYKEKQSVILDVNNVIKK